MADYIDNYKELCGRIVFEQLVDYDARYRAFLKSASRNKKWYITRMKRKRLEIKEGWAQYLDVDIELVLSIIESKARKGEIIIWKKEKTS